MQKIVGLIKSDTYTIAEICRQVGITPKTYHQWVNDYPEFAEAVEGAREERMQAMVIEAKKSLMKKIQGYEVTETKVVTVPGNGKDERGNPKPVIKELSYKPAPAAAVIDFHKGDMVQHTAFGRGLVLSVMKMGGDALLEIIFDQIGTKKLMAKTAFAHMKKL